jgi:DNA-binding MarR family transcriptional regulator
MDQDLDTLEEALGYLARAMSRPRLWQAIQKSANVTIDRPSAHLLRTLSDHDAGCNLHELAIKLGIEAPSVSRTVQRLEQDRLIVRIIDKTDRRTNHLRLTSRGLQTIKYLRRAKRELFKALFSSWSSTDRQQLVQLLHRLALEAAQTTDTLSVERPLKEIKL